MKYSITLVIAVLVTVVGCNRSPKPAAAPSPKPAAVTTPEPAAAVQTFLVEVGCADCVYSVDGISGCSVMAAKVDDRVVVASGEVGDVHSAGLCMAARKAEIVGRMQDDKLVVVSMTFAKPDDG